MNEHIKDFLNYYKSSDDPRYAVLLSGVWGCGKTHYIKNLLSEWKESSKDEDSEDIFIKPIYITLNGVSSIKTVNYLIKKEVSPFLYSKGVQTLKKIALGAIKIAAKIDFDVNNDGKDDISLSADLNLLDLFTSGDKKIKGDKLLIFDDIERCKIETDELLGYLNQFVEHHKCKIILIGDEDKIRELYDKDNSKIHYKDFKEKLIGQTFSLQIDVDNALEQFIKDCKEDETKVLLNTHKELIKETFETTAINNLRLLRQCLLEFERFISNIDRDLKARDEYQEFIRQVLVYFIIGYCEYKSGNENIEKFEIPKSDIEKELNGKYANFRAKKKLRASYYTLSFNNIIEYVSCSYIDSSLFNNLIRESECFRKDSLQLWERLWYYKGLNNQDYISLYKEVKDQFFNLQIDTIPELLHISGTLLSIQQDGLDKLIKRTIVSKAKKNIDNIFKTHTTSVGFETRASTTSYGKQCMSVDTKEFQTILSYAVAKDKNRIIQFRVNKMKDYFENLTDTSFNNIDIVLKESLPDRSKPYELTPIFQNISAQKLANGIVSLSNDSKYDFSLFLGERYYLVGSGYGGTIEQYHIDDLDTLIKLKDILKKKTRRLKLIEKINICKIVQTLTSVIDKLTIEKDTAPSF